MMTQAQVAKALLRLRPGAQWSLDDAGLTWNDTTPAPSQQELTDAYRDALKDEMCERIDAMAAAARSRYVTAGMDLVYDRKRREADYVADAAGQADPIKCPLLVASIGIEVTDTGNVQADLQAVANMVLSKESALASKAGQIEGIRLAGKKAVRAATNEDAAVAAMNAARLGLEAT